MVALIVLCLSKSPVERTHKPWNNAGNKDFLNGDIKSSFFSSLPAVLRS